MRRSVVNAQYFNKYYRFDLKPKTFFDLFEYALVKEKIFDVEEIELTYRYTELFVKIKKKSGHLDIETAKNMFLHINDAFRLNGLNIIMYLDEKIDFVISKKEYF